MFQYKRIVKVVVVSGDDDTVHYSNDIRSELNGFKLEIVITHFRNKLNMRIAIGNNAPLVEGVPSIRPQATPAYRRYSFCKQFPILVFWLRLMTFCDRSARP